MCEVRDELRKLEDHITHTRLLIDNQGSRKTHVNNAEVRIYKISIIRGRIVWCMKWLYPVTYTFHSSCIISTFDIFNLI